jgi:hypothetical protein
MECSENPTLAKTARMGHPTSEAQLPRNGLRPAFDLPMAILLEYLLERFFEAGEGAKAV